MFLGEGLWLIFKIVFAIILKCSKTNTYNFTGKKIIE